MSNIFKDNVQIVLIDTVLKFVTSLWLYFYCLILIFITFITLLIGNTINDKKINNNLISYFLPLLRSEGIVIEVLRLEITGNVPLWFRWWITTKSNKIIFVVLHLRKYKKWCCYLESLLPNTQRWVVTSNPKQYYRLKHSLSKLVASNDAYLSLKTTSGMHVI